MPRIALKLEYFGKRFCGSQYQSGVRTVQDELEKALGAFLRLEGQRAKVVFSGRTDSGVHASHQIAHFDCIDPDVDLWRLCWGLNGILDGDMSVMAAQYVPADFHARFSATRRSYCYRILNTSQRSALFKDNHYFISQTLDFSAMQRAAKVLVGHHDFQAFKSTNSDAVTTLCIVDRAEMLNLGEGKLAFCISANHFVYNMVRIIVGTLVEIGLGKRPVSDLEDALSSGQRLKAGPTAPPWGLCLESIEYPAHYQLFATTTSRTQQTVQ